MRKLIMLLSIFIAATIVEKISAQPINEIQKLLASDGSEKDEFGHKVSISGDYAIVGSFLDDDNGGKSGSAYIFHRNKGGANNWGQVAKLVASDGASGDYFGITVGISGNYAIVGAIYDGDGSAYIFNKDKGGDDNWGEVKKIKPSDGSNEYFGFAVSISNENAIVSDNKNVYVFHKDNGGIDNWGEIIKITPPRSIYQFIYEGYGDKSIDISGEYLVIGTDSSGYNGDYGAVYVYNKNFGGVDNWGLITKLTSNGTYGFMNDGFGKNVSISGDNIVVGAKTSSIYMGKAYVFNKDEGGVDKWGKVKILTASDGYYYSIFGQSVCISGNYILIGSQDDKDYDTPSGSAYLYYKDEGGINNWGEVNKLVATDVEDGQNFGWSVGLSNRIAIVGSNEDNDNGEESGSAYLFQFGNQFEFNDNLCEGEDFEYALINQEPGAIFRWQKNISSLWEDISGEINDTLIISSVTMVMDNYQYRCIISGASNDTTEIATLTVNTSYNQIETVTVCNGESFTFPDGIIQDNIASQVVYVSNLQTVLGCDSIIETTVNVNPVYSLSEIDVVCNGSSYTFPDGTMQNSITSQVVYVSNLQTVLGCDSIIETTINVNPIYNLSETIAVCNGGSYTFPDGTIQEDITSQVVYTSSLQTVLGCDSIIETTVNVNSVYNLSETNLVCSGGSFTFPDGTVQDNITSQVIYTSNLQTVSSCDSIIETTVNVCPVYNLTESVSICTGSDYTFPDGTTQSNITSQVVYISNLQSIFGCDSIIETAINVNPLPVSEYTYIVEEYEAVFTNNSADADSYNWDFNDGSTSTEENPTHIYTSPGEYIVVLSATNDCGITSTHDNIEIVITGFDKLRDIVISVYPNPTENKVNIDYDKEFIVEFYNMIGIKVLESNQMEIDISGLFDGTYIVLVKNNKNVLLKQLKLIKESK